MTFFEPAISYARRRPIVIASALAVVATGWLVTERMVGSPAERVEGPVSGPAHTFVATQSQWRSLTIEPVRQTAFDSVVTADGAIATNDNTTTPVYSPFTGRVTAIFVQPGQTVVKGAPLLQLQAIEAAQTQGDLAAANAAEGTARKQLELARINERRQHELFLAEAGAEKDWQQSQTDLAVAENAFRAAQVALLATRDKALALADPSRGAHARPGLATLSAPVAGLVVQRQVAPGQLISSLSSGGATPLFTISDPRTVWAVASVSEDQAAETFVGQTVEVTALALPGRVLRTKVTWTAALVDPTTRRLAVRAELPNADLALKPQMTITVRLLGGRPTAAVAVPRSALVFDGARARCYVVAGERTLAAREVQVGRIDGDLAEIRDGLSPTDRIVTRGALFIDKAAEAGAS